MRTIFEDYGPIFASEKLAERDGIEACRQTVRESMVPMVQGELWEHPSAIGCVTVPDDGANHVGTSSC